MPAKKRVVLWFSAASVRQRYFVKHQSNISQTHIFFSLDFLQQ
jgi:hypothetical protein